MTLAVFRPTPGRVTSSSIVRGTRPPKRSSSARLMAWRACVFWRKNPVGRMSASSSCGSARAKSSGVRKRAKSCGVTRLTMASVHWAERMVATSSSKALRWRRGTRGCG